MILTIYRPETITDAGATISFSTETLTSCLLLSPTGGAITLLANVAVNFTGTPSDGQVIEVIWLAGFTLNGNTFTINGIALTDLQALKEGRLIFQYVDGAAPLWISSYSPDLINTGTLSGLALQDATVTLAKLENVVRGSIILGNASNRGAATDFKGSNKFAIGDGVDLKSLAVAGDVTFTVGASTIVSAIGAGVVIDADINSAAAIARTKFAVGSANFIVTNNGSGVMSEAAFVTKAQGGFGESVAAKTGFTKWNAGTLDISAITVNRDLDISFEAAGGVVPSVGDFKIQMDFDGTLTGIYAYATKAIAATDNATIVAKNNGGTTMATGTVTFVAGDARGTAYSVLPSTNNTFVAGDILTFSSAKTTPGGWAHLSLKFTRLS